MAIGLTAEESWKWYLFLILDKSYYILQVALFTAFLAR